MRFVATFALVLVACPSPSPSPTPSASQSPLPTPSPTPTPTPPPSLSQSPPPPQTTTVDDAPAWFKSHGAAPPHNFDDAGSCTAVRFGTLDALGCVGGPPLHSVPDGESTYALRVAIVDHGRAIVALETAIVAGPLDPEVPPGHSLSEANYITLAWDVDADGVLAIHENPAETCDKVLAKYKGNELAPHRRMTHEACASRGKYVLRDAKLVRRP